MKKANVAIGLLLLAVATLVVVDAVRLGFRWGDNGPESGFFPFWLGVVLAACALIELRHVVVEHRRRTPPKPLMAEGAWKPIAWVLLPAVAMVAATELIGLHLAAALYLGFYMRAVGKIRWATTVAVAILVPAALYVAFDRFFLVPMPQGLWGAKLLPF
jgi:putative tricarboxylic transport membrane protein